MILPCISREVDGLIYFQDAPMRQQKKNNTKTHTKSKTPPVKAIFAETFPPSW